VLVIVGLITWAVSGVWLYTHGFEPELAAGSWLAFVAPFVAVTTGRVKGPPALGLLAVQALCALAMATLTGNLPAATLAVVAGQLPFLLGTRAAAAALAVQTLAFGAGLALRLEPGLAAMLWVSYSAFELFAFGAAHLAVSEQRARATLARVNSELLATQALLEHSSRQLERQRVSRELHDALGHHLTALSLQLEVAKNLVEGRAAEPVGKAHELAKGALAEVRAVVSSLRDAAPPDLSEALERVARAVPGLQVHLELAALPPVDEPRAALAVVRCVQEAITNAARHGGAKNVWVAVSAGEGQLTVTARDDGRGASAVQTGNGLKGLTERMAELGGQLTFDTRPGQGFRLTARIPFGAPS
jgi:signal transduction histidine kinase